MVKLIASLVFESKPLIEGFDRAEGKPGVESRPADLRVYDFTSYVTE